MWHTASGKGESVANKPNHSEPEGSSKLKSSQAATAIFRAFSIFLAIVAAAAILNIALNAKETAAAGFGFGIRIPPLKINTTAPTQNMTAVINGSDVAVNLPVLYNTTGLSNTVFNNTESDNSTVLVNVTLSLPEGWKKISNIRFNESGVIKNATLVAGEIKFEANLSATNVTMLFDADPPTITKIEALINITAVQHNLTVESENAFKNVSVSVEVNTSYRDFVLYWFNSTEFVDKSIEYNLRVVGGVATFDSFHTSIVLFRLEGALCPESWSCSAWSDSPNCGTRTCTDSNACGTTNSKPAESLTCPTPDLPSPGSGSGGGGGGGGGGVVAKETKAANASSQKAEQGSNAQQEDNQKESQVAASSADKPVNIFVKPGEIKKTPIRLTNTGKGKERLTIDIQTLNKIKTLGASLDKSYIELGPGESKTLTLSVLVDKDAQPGLYSGEIVITGGEGPDKIINVIIQVSPLKELFDTLVTVNPKTKLVYPGASVVSNLELFNLGGSGRFDVQVIYGIKDFSDNLIASKQQTVAVETRASLTGVLEIPNDAKPGQYYVFAVVVKDKSTVGVGSDTFEVQSTLQVGKQAPIEANGLFMIIAALIFIILLLTLISLAEIISHHVPHRHAFTVGPPQSGARKQEPAILRTISAIMPGAPNAGKAWPEAKLPGSMADAQKRLDTLEKSFEESSISVKQYIDEKVKINRELKDMARGKEAQ